MTQDKVKASAQINTLATWLVLVAGWTGALLFTDGQFFPDIVRFDSFGTHDFIQYWAAFKIFTTGGDPYHPRLMLETQLPAGWSVPNVPLMMWNPPWILVLMAPVLGREFLTSAQLWFGVSLTLIGLAWFLTERTFPTQTKTPPFLRLVLCFILFPIEQALFYGQSSVLLVFGLATVIYGIKREKNWISALGLVCITLKPHLFLFFFALLATEILRRKNFNLIASILVAFGSVAVALTLVAPSIWIWWLADPLSKVGPEEVMLPSIWKSATVISILIYDYLPGELPIEKLSLLRTVVPLTLAAVYFLYQIQKPNFTLSRRTIARSISASLLLSPYGWVMDQSLLLIPQVLLLLELEEQLTTRRFIFAIIPIAALNAVYGWYCNTQVYYHHEMFWLPLAFFILAEFYYMRLRETETEIARDKSVSSFN